MAIRAWIYDLDNTLFAMPTVGDRVYAGLYELLEPEIGAEKLGAAKKDLMRIQFQKVADKYGFAPELKARGIQYLNGLVYEGPIQAFGDYGTIRELKGERFLVTMGFERLQWSKIVGLDIEGDFTECVVVDPEKTGGTKQDIFWELLGRHGLEPEEVVVVGDDPESEIAAGDALGMRTVLIDVEGLFEDYEGVRVRSLKGLKGLGLA